MKWHKQSLFALVLILTCVPALSAAGRYHRVTYPPSDKTGELQVGVTYTLWIPDGVETIRGVIVHQHGCGVGACKGGATAAYDLHWQALARKWDCALLGPSYHQKENQNCRLWCDPRNGSAKTFLRGLHDLARLSKHPEIETVPWCLWGHSGGGFWASLMQTAYPDRIIAIWFRSGTAYMTWEKGEIDRPTIPKAAYAIPFMCNPGVKEKDHPRFKGAWNAALAMFKAYRAKGAPCGFAPDPRTGHECGDSRYLAIPFFDACLAMRLPDPDGKSRQLRPVDWKPAWLAALSSAHPQPASSYKGKVEEAIWLPNERVAQAWAEYVKTGAVSDRTPPPSPIEVKVVSAEDQIRITWDAQADLESGLQAFVILRDGEEVGRVPEKPAGRFGRPLFQRLSYHDTPESPLPKMAFVDRTAKKGTEHVYEVLAVNSVGLRSKPARAKAVLANKNDKDATSARRPLKVFILAGQSNMQGHAHVRTINAMAVDPKTAPILKDILDADGKPRVCEKVWISSIGCAPEEQTGRLTAGFGAQARGPKIGPEFTFGIYMEKFLDQPILIIKTAWGGKSLNTHFRPPSAGPYQFNKTQLETFQKQNKDIAKIKAEKDKATGVYYRLMIDHVKKVLADIKRVYPDYDPKQGYELAGFVWFQGWNDMVDRGTYPDNDKPGGYSEYSRLLAHFIRDVRKDLGAPKMPFVIGVMGVGGPTDRYGPSQQRYKKAHQNFRDAMAAPAKMPEFKGNVAAVLTENYWDLELAKLQEREKALKPKIDAINKMVKEKKLSREEGKAAIDKLYSDTFTKKELITLKESVSNAGFHYMGSAKIMTQIGKGFAEAMVELMRKK
ncbi:MAG: hypothetical protein KatS3mg105_0284 [Gemmatales bacterium]|nr:MAG: hypothetical protein KatS3mg105_0284 [Gemmatales bacterium]